MAIRKKNRYFFITVFEKTLLGFVQNILLKNNPDKLTPIIIGARCSTKEYSIPKDSKVSGGANLKKKNNIL